MTLTCINTKMHIGFLIKRGRINHVSTMLNVERNLHFRNFIKRPEMIAEETQNVQYLIDMAA